MTADKDLYDAVIVGGGPAGLTAALYLARARYRVLVVEKEHFGGQITITAEVVNYPGVARTSGAELTETMRRQAEDFGAEFLRAEVTGLKLQGDIKEVQLAGRTLRAFSVLLATGANPRRLGFKGEAEFRGRGFGMMTMAGQYGAMCGPLISGAVAHFLDLHVQFMISGFLLLILCVYTSSRHRTEAARLRGQHG